MFVKMPPLSISISELGCQVVIGQTAHSKGDFESPFELQTRQSLLERLLSIKHKNHQKLNNMND